jgi:hypothetical protein
MGVRWRIANYRQGGLTQLQRKSYFDPLSWRRNANDFDVVIKGRFSQKILRKPKGFT